MNKNIYFSWFFVAFFFIFIRGNAQNIDIGANNAGQVNSVWSCAADGVTYTISDDVTVIGTLISAPATITFNIANNGITISWDADITGSDGLVNSLINITGASNTFIINGTIEANGTKSSAVETTGHIIVETTGSVYATGTYGVAIYATNSGNIINVLGKVEVIGYDGIGIKTESANATVVISDDGNVKANCSGIGIQTEGSFNKVNVIGGTVLADNFAIYCIGVDNEVFVDNDATIFSSMTVSITTEGINNKVEVVSGEIGDINTTGDNTNVLVSGGFPGNILTEGNYTKVNISGGEVISITSFGDDTTISVSDGTVEGIITEGDDNIVMVSGGIVRDTTGTAISATGYNNLVNVSGTGEVVTTTGIAIYSTSTVTIEGGIVSAFDETSLGFGIAIKHEDASSAVTVRGGVVRATYGVAIESIGQVAVTGGIVFAFGDDIKGAGNVINADTFTDATGTGIVIGWDKEKGNTVYCIYSETDLSKSPPNATAMWDIENNASGIRFANGTNIGFIKIKDIYVKRVPTINDFDFQIIDKEYDCQPFNLQIIAINGNPTFEIFYNDVPDLPINVGTYQITINIISTDAGSDFCIANDIYLGTLTINPALLTVIAQDAIMIYGSNPNDVDLEYIIEGFACAENESVLTQLPTINIASDITSNTLPGVYPDRILVSGGAADNYYFEYIFGTLTIVSTELIGINVNGQAADKDGDNFVFTDTQCGNPTATILVLTADPLATIIINDEYGNNRTFFLTTGINEFIITVISQNGQIESTYLLTIERMIPFEQLVKIRWSDNTFTVINNPGNNGGFNFNSATFQWFFNDDPIPQGTGQSLSFDPHGGAFTQGNYHVEITTSSGVLKSCQYYVSFGKMGINIYPNPVSKGQTIYIETDTEDEIFKDATIEVYNYLGLRVANIKTEGTITPVNLNFSTGVHFFIVTCKNGLKKELKIIVQ
ncbi:MAG: T9SS type A sorting domain-containing protein [Marinilabiliaceae bacterium]|nr:T9SS type A sorting domain-containing protein [Marinilabiliaceae bacterium]